MHYCRTRFTPNLDGVRLTSEEQGKDDDELVHSMAKYVLHHGPGDEGLVPTVGFT